MNHANANLQQVSKYGSSFTGARRSFQIDDELACEWPVSGAAEDSGGGWCTFASSAVLEGCMMFHFASLGQGAASTVSALVQPCKWCTE
jgi:hypothetical protein